MLSKLNLSRSAGVIYLYWPSCGSLALNLLVVSGSCLGDVICQTEVSMFPLTECSHLAFQLLPVFPRVAFSAHFSFNNLLNCVFFSFAPPLLLLVIPNMLVGFLQWVITLSFTEILSIFNHGAQVRVWPLIFPINANAFVSYHVHNPLLLVGPTLFLLDSTHADHLMDLGII